MLDATESCLNLFTVVFVRLPTPSVIQIQKHAMAQSDDVPMVGPVQGFIQTIWPSEVLEVREWRQVPVP